MREQKRPPRREGLLAALGKLAGSQHGVVSVAQLYLLGFSRQTIGRLVAAGHLHRLYRGVYAVGHTALKP